CVLTACVSAGPDRSTREETERYAVWSAAIEHLFVRPGTGRMIVADQTEGVISVVAQMANGHVSKDTWDNFVAQNRRLQPVGPHFETTTPIAVVHDPRWADDWAHPLSDFPEANGLISLSAVGFNQDL